MAEEPSEVEQLAAELRALLQDRIARGIPSEAIEAPRPAVIAAWNDAAREARTPKDTGAVALRRVRDELGDCTRCPLCKTRKTLVFGVGDPDADLVVVGEGPGEQEDKQGEPFVGPAGQMLDKMLENVLGLPRARVYILNVVKCRPPGNRNPAPEEIAACRPFLEAQIRAIAPKLILVLGGVAFKALMHTEQGITRSRGRWMVYRDPEQDLQIPVMPTFHPAYLLRTPEDKRHTFADLKEVRARYDREGGRRT